MYNALTGFDRPADSSGALRVGQTFKDNEGHYRQATLEDVQNAGKLGGEAFGRNAAEGQCAQPTPRRLRLPAACPTKTT